MKRATNITEIPNAFPPSPLTKDEMDEFYDADTMYVRTGKKYDSPIADIYNHCTDPANSTESAVLLFGHRGCGKSTELNKMEETLTKKHYQVRIIDCWKVLDMYNMDYTDILILLGDALLDIADKSKCRLPDEKIKKIENFWRASGVKTIVDNLDRSLGASGGISTATPPLLQGLLGFFFDVKADLKQSSSTSVEYKKQIERSLAEWNRIIRDMADTIADKCDGKQPIIIFEGLDKLDSVSPDKAWDLFSIHGGQLSSYSFPIVYTFPIALSYDPRFHAVESYFQGFIMPMIKLHLIDGRECTEGMQTIRKIVEMRADLSLFDGNSLNLAIEKTGGCLRDLFNVIRTAATFARRGKKDKIEEDMVLIALEKIKSDITRRIEGKQHDFLVEIYNGMHMKIQDKPMLLQMMQANAVLEYNGKRWHDVHPLVADYLVDDLHMTERRSYDR